MAKADTPHPRSLQYAALPVMTRKGETLVAMVTSRETKRWIIPKGRPEKGMKPHAVAAREAFEEAGLKGETERRPFDAFDSVKRLNSGVEIPCVIQVYLMRVERVLEDWPEKAQRERRWVTPAEGARLAGEPGLARILLRLAAKTKQDAGMNASE